MSPCPTESQAPISPKRADNSQVRLDNKGQPPSDNAAVIPNSSQTAQEEKVNNASAKLQSAASDGVSIPANNGPATRFKLDIRGSENDFKFPPAPRHAPGHFTNRKIVPRVDGPRTEQRISHQQSSNSVPKEHQNGANCTSPSVDATHNRPIQFSSLAPSPLSVVHTADGTHKESTPLRRIGLPFAKNYLPPVPLFNGESQATPEITQQPPLDTTQADQARRSPKPPVQSAESLPSTEHRNASNDVEIHSPPTSKLQSFIQEVAPPVSAPGSLRAHPRERLAVIIEEVEWETPTTDEGGSDRHQLMESPQQPMMSVETQSNGHSNSRQWMSDHRATRTRRPKQNNQVNRPMRLVPPGREDFRSSSVSSSDSGVSKRKARSIRDLDVFRDRDLPEVANKVNDLWKLCNDAVKEAETDSHHKVDKYRKKLLNKSQKLASYRETIDIQAQAVHNLEGENQKMNVCIENLEQRVQAYSDKFPKLMDLCQTLKDTLDSTLKEHARHKNSSQKAIEDIRAEKQREQSARELVERQLDAVREHLKERVRQVVEQSQEECRRVNDKVQLLLQQVKEKDSQARRERDITDQLSKQLEEYRQTQPSLEDMRAQTSEIFKMLDERRSDDRIEQVKLAQTESTAKLDHMTEHLESLRDLLVPQSQAVATLGDRQAEGLSRITSTIQKMYEAQNGSKETVEQLGKDLQAHLDKMQQHLEAHADALTQQLGEERDQNGKLKAVIEQGKQERQSLERQLQEMTNTGKEQEERIQDLVRKVDELDAQPREDPEARLRSQILSRENDDLKAQLAAKCSNIADLETGLNAKNERYAHELMRLTQRMEYREEAAKSATDKTLATAQEESQIKLQRLEAEMRERLQQAGKDRRMVVNELDETRKKLEAAEQRQREEHGGISALQAALDEADTRNKKLFEDLKQKEAELANDKSHSATIWEWAASKAEEIGLDVDKTWKDADVDGGSGKWTLLLERVFAEIDMHRGSPGEALPAGIVAPNAADNGYSHTGATPSASGHPPIRSLTQEPARSGQDEDGRVPQQAFNLRPPNMKAGILGADLRRVTVQSPRPGVLTPIPSSVEEEQSRRRGNKQRPKPIMTRVTRSSAHAEELRLGQDLESSASSLSRGFGSLRTHPFAQPPEIDGKEEIDMDGSGTPSAAGEDRNAQGAAAESGSKIVIINSKRSRQTTEAEPIGLFPSPVRPKKGRDLGVEEDDDDIPQVKRAKVQKPKAPASSRRGKNTASRTRKQKPMPSLATPGVVYGSFPPGVVQGGRHPPSEPKTKS